MGAPSKSWTDIADVSVSSGSVMPKAAVLEDLRDNFEHVEEMIGASYTAAQAHSHDGTDSAAVSLSWSGNLLSNATPQAEAYGAWSFSGPIDLDGLRGAVFPASTTDYALQRIGNVTNLLPMFGSNGNDFTISCFARMLDTSATSGVLSFGFSENGGTSTFLSNMRAQLAYSAMSPRWTRYYSVFEQADVAAVFPPTTSLCALWRTSTAFDISIAVSGFMVNMGTTLQPFRYSNQEDCKDHSLYRKQTQLVPLFDWQIGMVDAVEVTPS